MRVIQSKLLQKISDSTSGIVNPANLISFSRPAIAFYGLEYYSDDPLKLTLAVSLAFLTDFADGNVARATSVNNSNGAYVDIFSDRALELMVMWHYAGQDLISGAIPLTFTIKGLIVDSTRLYRDFVKRNFTNPLKYGGNENRLERGLYGGLKCLFLSGVPILDKGLTHTLGVLTTLMGVYRGSRAIINK